MKTKNKKQKRASKKVVVTGQPSLRLVSYEIKAIIPTGPYANIQPTIIVEARNLEEAEGYVIPHINKLFDEFLNRGEKHVQIINGTTRINPSVPIGIETVQPVHRTVDNNPDSVVVNTPQSVPISESPAFIRARNAINACASKEALAVIREKVEKSEKLSDKEKFDLVEMIIGSPIS